VTTLVDGGKAYAVVFPDGAGFNPGYQIAKPEEYPGINQDYRDTLHFLESLHPDIWLAHHTECFDLEGKRTRAPSEGVMVAAVINNRVGMIDLACGDSMLGDIPPMTRWLSPKTRRLAHDDRIGQWARRDWLKISARKKRLNGAGGLLGGTGHAALTD